MSPNVMKKLLGSSHADIKHKTARGKKPKEEEIPEDETKREMHERLKELSKKLPDFKDYEEEKDDIRQSIFNKFKATMKTNRLIIGETLTAMLVSGFVVYSLLKLAQLY